MILFLAEKTASVFYCSADVCANALSSSLVDKNNWSFFDLFLVLSCLYRPLCS